MLVERCKSFTEKNDYLLKFVFIEVVEERIFYFVLDEL